MKFSLHISLILATLAICSCDNGKLGKRSISAINGLLGGSLAVNTNVGANIYAGAHGYGGGYAQPYALPGYAPAYGGHYISNGYGGNSQGVIVYKLLNNAGFTSNYGPGYYPGGTVTNYLPLTAIRSAPAPVKVIKVIPQTSAYLGGNYVNNNVAWHPSGYYGGDWNKGW
ncbi:hypothetical protein GQX74_007217 [Glossina fuscipes]|nr:hypothetical protein GQX74_007217 [Glossina fuscipes]